LEPVDLFGAASYNYTSFCWMKSKIFKSVLYPFDWLWVIILTLCFLQCKRKKRILLP